MAEWTKEEVLRDAKRFTSRSEWYSRSPGIWGHARRMGIYDEACAHMTITRDRQYTLEECQAIAKRFRKRADWRNYATKAYRTAKENGWLDLCCGHMKPINQL